MIKKEKCAFCGVEESLSKKLQRCGSCKSELYCSRECQKSHWKTHKKICKEKRKMQKESKRANYIPQTKSRNGKFIEDTDEVMFFTLDIMRTVSKEKIDIFLNWLKEKGVKFFKNVEIRKVNGKGLGLVALESIKENETYISIPREAVFDLSGNYESIKNKKVRKFARKLRTKDSSYGFEDNIVVLIYHKFFLKEKSPFWPYLEVLPSVEDVLRYPNHMSRKQLSVLENTLMRIEIEKEQRETDFSYQKIKKMSQVCGEKFKVTKKMVQWGFGILRRAWPETSANKTENLSNSWNPQSASYGQKHTLRFRLVPLLDFINSGLFPNDSGIATREDSAGTINQKCLAGVEKGQEILQPCNYSNFSEQLVTEGFFCNVFKDQWECNLGKVVTIQERRNGPGVRIATTLPMMKDVSHPALLVNDSLCYKPMLKFMRLHPGATKDGLELMKKYFTPQIAEYLEMEYRVIVKTMNFHLHRLEQMTKGGGQEM